MLDTIAKAPVQAAWNWLCNSWAGVINAPGLLIMALQAAASLVATGLLTIAVSWFVAVKATEVTVVITSKGMKVIASTVSGSSVQMEVPSRVMK